MSPRLLAFVQVKLPAMLSVPDGRWLLRAADGGEGHQVAIVHTVEVPSAPTAAIAPPAPPAPARTPDRDCESHRERFTFVTVVDGDPLPSPETAGEVLARIEAEEAIDIAFGAIDRLCEACRIAAADDRAGTVDRRATLALWAGYGEGEQLSVGRSTEARRLRLPADEQSIGPSQSLGPSQSTRQIPSMRARRSHRRGLLAGAAAQERIAALLSGREVALICEELVLRASSDLKAGRYAHCAIELERAYAAALSELADHPGVALAGRYAELQRLHQHLAAQAAGIVAGAGAGEPSPVDRSMLSSALQSLQAALRARRLLKP